MKAIYLLAIISFSNGMLCSVPKGTYQIMGYAIFEDNERIPNRKIIVNQTDTITTDENGFFTYTIKWQGESKTNIFQKERKNPKWLIFSFKTCYKAKIKNKWKKYGLRRQWNNKINIYVKNIYFKKYCTVSHDELLKH